MRHFRLTIAYAAPGRFEPEAQIVEEADEDKLPELVADRVRALSGATPEMRIVVEEME